MINIIDEHLQIDYASELNIEIDAPRFDFPKYQKGIDLKPFKLWETSEGLYVIKLHIETGDFGICGKIEQRTGELYGMGALPVQGFEDIKEQNKKRYYEIKKLWEGLEKKVADYNKKYNFTKIDIKKSEFF